MCDMLFENADVFSKSPGQFVECKLDIYDHVPFREKERQVPYKLREAVQENLRKLIREGILKCAAVSITVLWWLFRRRQEMCGYV